MRSVCKGPDSDVELCSDHDGDFHCYNCSLVDGDEPFNLGPDLLTVKGHVSSHLARGHLLPRSFLDSLQADLQQEGILHVGLWYRRCHYSGASASRETAFAIQWMNENERGLGSRGTLRELLDHIRKETGIGRGEIVERGLGDLNQRDATVAATMMQWLGTNVGWCFLGEVLKRAGYKVEKI